MIPFSVKNSKKRGKIKIQNPYDSLWIMLKYKHKEETEDS